MDVNGDISKQVGINNVYEMDDLSSGVVEPDGVPVEIRSKASIDYDEYAEKLSLYSNILEIK